MTIARDRFWRRLPKRIRPPYWFSQLRNMLSDSKSLWRQGLPDELKFWKDLMVKAKGGVEHPYVANFLKRLDPQAPLDEKLTSLLNRPPGTTVDILDIGAGPLTWVGKVWEGRTIRITAIDALADEYNRLLDVYDFKPPVRTRLGHGESLASMFAPDTFDLVHARNALDHSYDPLSILQQAMIVLKPNSWMFLSHFVNEGATGYSGLHQWNFCEEEGKFVIWNIRRHILVEQHLPLVAEVRINVYEAANERLWIDVGLRKRI